MANWVPVANVSDCPPGAGLEIVVASQIVAIFNVDGDVYALDGVCPHQGGPLGKGRLVGTAVTCPWHGWQFCVRTGAHTLNRSLCQLRFPVRVEGDTILLDVAVLT